MKSLLIALVTITALLVTWRWMRPQDLAAWPQATGVMQPPPSAPAGLYKCRQGSQVTYTQQPCPTGSQTQAISGGSVTTLPAQRPAVALPSLPASLPNARALAGEPLDPDIMARRIDRAVGE